MAAAPSTLVVGPESFLAERAVAEVLAGARRDDPATERVDVDLSLPDAASHLADALAPTLFGGGCVVVAAAADSADDDALAILLRAAGSPEPGLTLVVVHPGGQKGRGVADRLRKAVAEVVTVAKPKPKDVDTFLVNEFRHHRRRITPDALAALRSAVGDELRALAAAAGQLAVDVEADPIDASAVTAYYEGIAGVKPYEVSDAVWDGDTQKALVALRWALELRPNDAALPVTATLAGSLRNLLALSALPGGMSDRDIAAEIGLPATMAWKVRSLKQTARKWSPQALARATLLLAQVDAAMKGGIDGEGLDPTQKHLLIERTVVRIADSQHRRSVGG